MPAQPRATSSQRSDAARERARALREAAERQRRRRRVLGLSAGVVAVLVVVAVVALLVTRHSASTATAGSRPAGTTAQNGILTGGATAAHRVVIYQDYQCPYCQAFEASANGWLESQRDAGKISLEFRPLAFLDASSQGNEYSTRAANAAACVAGDPDIDFSAWNDAMYAQQPEEGGTGRSDSDLIAIEKKLGGGASVGRCIVGQDHVAWVKRATASAMSAKGGITGTPTVLVDGEQVGAAGTVPTLAQVKTALGASDS